MKICVLIPSEEYRNLAGARIRYGRINVALQKTEHTLDLKEINDLDSDHLDHDVYIISKCHDAQSLIWAHLLVSEGKRVGVDLFDDYFTHASDSRFSRFRAWLTTLIDVVDFVLCSTPAMVKIANDYRGGIPTHILNDPSDNLRTDELADLLQKKLTLAKQSMTLEIGWFGVGDNVHFPVGLPDLSFFGRNLAALRDSDWGIQLTVLTNRRAMTSTALAQLRKLPVPFHLEEWSESRERELLEKSLFCFLPVNAQNFSIAKSLNRAVSALSSGCQVLSSGYPLYDRLQPLIYRDAVQLLDDLNQNHLKLRPASIAQYSQIMEALASPETESVSLINFLEKLRPTHSDDARHIRCQSIALIHGLGTTGFAHKLIKRIGGISIASPFNTTRLGFDAIFRTTEANDIQLFIHEKCLDRLTPRTRARATLHGRIADQNYWTLAPVRKNISPTVSFPVQLVSYAKIVIEMERMLEEAFGELTILLSEISPLPFLDDVYSLDHRKNAR